MDIDTPPIRLLQVCKAYGKTPVIEEANFRAKRGEFVVIVGRSGSGKSTLLNLIGGLDRPDSGEVLVSGHSPATLDERNLSQLRRVHLGFVFQFFNLIPTLTVAENIRLPLALNGLSKKDSILRTKTLLEELFLTDFGKRFPEELSGGEQQRVAIARALVHEPAIVLADEPTGNLDLETATNVLELLNDACRQRGATLVMATHSHEMVGHADRVLTIRNGCLKDIKI